MQRWKIFNDCKFTDLQTKKIQWYRLNEAKVIEKESDLLSLAKISKKESDPLSPAKISEKEIEIELVEIKLEDGRKIGGYSDASGIGGHALQTFMSGNTLEGTLKDGKFAGHCKYTDIENNCVIWYNLAPPQEIKSEETLGLMPICAKFVKKIIKRQQNRRIF